MGSRYPVIDLSDYPPLTLVEIPDEEAVIADRMALVKEVWAREDPPYFAQYDVEETEFDPIKIAQEVGASFEVNGLNRVNQMGRATTLAHSWGDNLDAIGARFPGGALRVSGYAVETFKPGVPRLNKGLVNEETDDRYRRRLWLASNALSTAGSELGYVFWALTAVPALRDVTATVRRPTRNTQPVVHVTCLSERADPNPSVDELDEVRRVLALPGIGTLTDIVSVSSPRIIDVAVRALLYRFPGPDAALLLRRALEAYAAMVERHRYLGFDASRNEVAAALQQPGVSYAQIDFPELIQADPTTFIRFGPASIRNVGIRE